VAVLEFHPFNRPDLTFRVDAADARLLAKCKRWHAVKKPKSLTFYVQGCNGAARGAHAPRRPHDLCILDRGGRGRSFGRIAALCL
jgi:hypothetical protein